MEIDNSQVQGLFRNCLDVLTSKEGFIPVRFTKKQMEAYSQEENFRIRSLCPAGICLDLLTDSKYIKLKYKVKGIARDWISFDIFINDILVESFGQKPIDKNSSVLCFDIPVRGSQLRRVTIYLPPLVELIITAVEVSEGAVFKEAEKKEKSLLCLGDSITQGMEAYHSSSTYPVLLSRLLDMNLLNQGVGGYVFNSESLDGSIKYRPDIITVAYGTNDWGRYKSLEKFSFMCKAYMDKLTEHYSESKIFVMTPLWRSDLEEEKPTGTLSDIIAEMKHICTLYPKITVIDGMELLPHLTSIFGDEYLHPTDEGFLHIAMNLYKKIYSQS